VVISFKFSKLSFLCATKLYLTLLLLLVKPILTYNSEISFMDSYLKLFRAILRAEKKVILKLMN